MERVKQLASHFVGSSAGGLAALERKSPDDIVITMAIRSPLCKARSGGFKDTRSDELLTEMFKQAIAHSKIDPSIIGDINVGTVLPRAPMYEARAAALAAGIPHSVPIQTVNRFCSSGLMAVTSIANQIRAGQISVGLAIGVESMSANPDQGPDPASEEISCHPTASDSLQPMGWTSENVAGDFNISREDMDEFAAISFQRAERADKAGFFKDEIVSFTVFKKDPKTDERTKVVISKDDGIRSGTKKETLGKIRAAFPQWPPAQTTGGNASQITDGAAAVLLMTRKKAEELGQPILAKYITTSVAGLAPRVMGMGPSYAIPMVLEATGLTKEDVDIFEINEAFASMLVYCVRKLDLDHEKVNVNGGAIALGHPLDKFPGARQIATGLNELKRRNGKVLVTSMCIGTGMGCMEQAGNMLAVDTAPPSAHCLSLFYTCSYALSYFFFAACSAMASYNSINNNPQHGQSPYGSGDPYYHESTGYISPPQPKKRISNWVKIGVPVLVLVIIGAVLGGVLGSRSSNNKSSSSSSGGSSAPQVTGEAAASAAASAKNAIGRFATSTNSEFMMPVYPSTTDSAAFTSPTFNPSSNAAFAWPSDSFKPSNPSPTSVRPDRPRLIAPAYKWQALPNLISNDPYLKGWNDTIFGNATAYAALPPVVYHMDGGSGILDNAREIKMRIKAFSYAYRMTNNTDWVNRAWTEIQNAAGNGTTSFGPDVDKWNSAHFLDTAEFTAAFAIAYDWLNDQWSDTQKSQMIFTMNKYGLSFGVSAYEGDPGYIGWWNNNTEGNWNCVCNSGLTLGALAILGDDTTGNAEKLLGYTIPNAKANCDLAISTDGTWAETANYWYFGTTGHAEMTSALITATGSDYGLLSTNSNFYKTGIFHMYVTGATSLFNYGDHGPNKFSTTANSMIFYASQYNQPQFTLFQRDQHDAPEPWSMFWYDPTVSGAFWDGTALDQFFDDGLDQWASMRSSWTDNDAMYVAAKAGKLQGHQTHNDLDCGDFVIDALGTRWAGELGSGDYLSTGYFSNDNQDSQRWLYYRKRTEGQNTILVDQANQDVSAAPTVKHDTSGTTQGSSTVFNVPSDSTAYWTANLTSAYFNVTSLERGVRFINGRKQVLVQDDINSQGTVMWRMHTNATVSVDSSGTSATLTLDGQTLKMEILNAPSGASFTTGPAVRFSGDPALPSGQSDQPNPGVTVVMISLPAGSYNLQVLFNPQWSGMQASDFKMPPFVAIDNWSLTSHN
ncbi:hypothetical protein EW146_g5957 [Bondarzewia mesenterica]|uniref:Thiolase N-terminal domain-containing protein n=1 Tax=Bondarzewia mesenterica TaxID=1095465 RepID=A0A4S4LPZ0_9AGAM|nr:hypothetical protein EW146_g5957 [Bondarzewia mesenterica]